MGNHHEQQGLKRISGASQFTIPNLTGMSSDLAGIKNDTRFSGPNQACCNADFSYPLISCISCPSSFSFSFSRPQLYQHHKNT
jgi:hypothetical protein